MKISVPKRRGDLFGLVKLLYNKGVPRSKLAVALLFLIGWGAWAQEMTAAQRAERSREIYEQARKHSQGQGSSEWLSLLDRAIDMDPENAKAIQQRAVWEIKTGSLIHCFELLDRAVALEPKWVGYRGTVKLYFVRDYEGAIRDLDAFDELTPGPDFMGDYSVNYLRGMAKRQLGDYRAAIAEFDRDLAIMTPKGSDFIEPTSWYYRGICKWKLGDRSGAATDFERMIEHSPQLPEGHYMKGLLLVENKNRDAACASFRNAFARAESALRGAYTEVVDQLYRRDIEQRIEETCP